MQLKRVTTAADVNNECHRAHKYWALLEDIFVEVLLPGTGLFGLHCDRILTGFALLAPSSCGGTAILLLAILKNLEELLLLFDHCLESVLVLPGSFDFFHELFEVVKALIGPATKGAIAITGTAVLGIPQDIGLGLGLPVWQSVLVIPVFLVVFGTCRPLVPVVVITIDDPGLHTFGEEGNSLLLLATTEVGVFRQQGNLFKPPLLWPLLAANGLVYKEETAEQH